LGEVDLDEPDRLPRHAHRRRILAQRSEGVGPLGRRAGPHPQQRDRVRVPDVQPAAAGQRAPQRRAAVDLRRAAGQRATRARPAPGPPPRRARRARRADERLAVRRYLVAAPAALLVGLAGCKQAESAPLYEKIAVVRRDVVVTAAAEGVIEPILKFSVKSKAWGQILAMPVQTGDEVQKGQLLAKIDPRLPQNNLAQAQAALDKAQAQLANATA